MIERGGCCYVFASIFFIGARLTFCLHRWVNNYTYYLDR